MNVRKRLGWEYNTPSILFQEASRLSTAFWLPCTLCQSTCSKSQCQHQDAYPDLQESKHSEDLRTSLNYFQLRKWVPLFGPFVRINIVRNVLTARLLLIPPVYPMPRKCRSTPLCPAAKSQEKDSSKHKDEICRLTWCVGSQFQRCSCCTCALISTLTLSIVVSSPWERIASRSTSTVQSTKSTRLSLLYRPWALPVSNRCHEKTPRHNPWNCASSLWPCVPPATQQEKNTSDLQRFQSWDAAYQVLPHKNIIHKSRKNTPQKPQEQNHATQHTQNEISGKHGEKHTKI